MTGKLLLRRNAIGLALLSALLVPALAQSGEDWPSYRGGPTMSGVAHTALAPPFSLKWTYETGSSVESTAAIVGDTVFIATKTGAVHALRLSDGERIWKFISGGAGFSASPCVVGDRVHVGDEAGVFWALSRGSGHELWKWTTGGKIMSSATATGESLLFGSYDNFLYDFNLTGDKRWSFRTEAQVHCAPCVAEGLALIAGCDGKLRMVDLESHAQRRAVDLGGNYAAAPAYQGGSVYLGNMLGQYMRVRVADGQILWQQTDSADGAAFYASAAVTDGAAVFASRSGLVFRALVASGYAKWVFRTGGQINSSPVICGDYVYFGGDDGNLYGVRLSDGQEVWRFSAGAPVYASPALGQGRLVIGSTDGAVYCFGS